MNTDCEHCKLHYEREPGFFLGSIYFNYGIPAIIASLSYPIAVYALKYPRNQTIIAIVAFVVLFPLWFHRYARSLWLGFDHFIDPRNEVSSEN